MKERVELLRRLHHGERPLVLPNAWDAASAHLVVDAGFPVVATSSGAIAASLGYADADVMPPDEAFAAVARIARAVEAPVTADMEAGYGLGPKEFVERLLEAGAVGCNLEDTDHHGDGVLMDAARHADRLAAIVQAFEHAGVPIVVNARIDVFLRSPADGAFDGALDRARRYREAGAACVYPIGLSDPALIHRFVDDAGAPVNIMARADAPPLATLAELGVARVSYASGLFRVAKAAIVERLAEISVEAGHDVTG